MALLNLYRQEDTTACRLSVQFLGEEGDDFSRLTKEMFTIFWRSVAEELLCGGHRVVPRLPLRRERKEAWKYVSLGRILSHTVALTETLPVMLSTSLLLNVIFETDVAEECLLEDFLLYITDRENSLLRKAMGSFACLTEGEQNRLQHFFTAHNYFDFLRCQEIKDQILAIAEEELVKRPAFLCAQIRKGIPESHRAIFWAQLSIDHLKYMQEKQRATQEKVVSCLVTQNSDLTAQEDTTYYYLQEFISSLNENHLVKFLLFVTGSVHQPSKITVMFNATAGVMRCPTVHTCSNILELSSTYVSFQEFRREFSMVLDSPEAYQYSMI